MNREDAASVLNNAAFCKQLVVSLGLEGGLNLLDAAIIPDEDVQLRCDQHGDLGRPASVFALKDSTGIYLYCGVCFKAWVNKNVRPAVRVVL